MPAQDVPAPQDPADALAAVAAPRRLADQFEDAGVEQAMRAGWGRPEVAEAREEGSATTEAHHLLPAIAAVEDRKDLRSAHPPLGVLSAGVGTGPRTLALAGLDRAGLMDLLQETLARENR